MSADSESDDSYEAALRAADALFSSPSKGQTANGREAAGALPEGSSDRATPDRGGRILRAIDEPPPPQYAALEAEFAPKRRGRKPGSKNKPKVPALTRNSEIVAFTTPQMAETASVEVAEAIPSSQNSSQRRITALTSTATPARTQKRFPWVRDRLKPGEDWKRRRLPKVCW